MKRSEERSNAADKFTADKKYLIERLRWLDGAEWADENPDEQMITKYLHEKKGYPIDLNGNLPSFEETMNDVEKYNKYKEDKLIEKTCEYLKALVYQEFPGGPSVRQIDDEKLEKLRKVMKGE